MAGRHRLAGVLSLLPLVAAAAPPAPPVDVEAMAAFLEFLGEEAETDDELKQALLSVEFDRAAPPAAGQDEGDDDADQKP